MSITLKTNQIKLKIQNGNYQAPVLIADQTTSEHITEVNTAITTTGNQQVSAIQTKGDEVLNSIPEDYTDLVEEVDDLKSAINNSINAIVCEIEDGIVGNTGNQNGVRTNNYIPVSNGDKISICIKRPLTSPNNHYCVSYAIFDSQKIRLSIFNPNEAYKNDFDILISNADAAYIQFSIVEYAGDTIVRLRKTDFGADDVVAFISDSVTYPELQNSEVMLDDLLGSRTIPGLLNGIYTNHSDQNGIYTALIPIKNNDIIICEIKNIVNSGYYAFGYSLFNASLSRIYNRNPSAQFTDNEIEINNANAAFISISVYAYSNDGSNIPLRYTDFNLDDFVIRVLTRDQRKHYTAIVNTVNDKILRCIIENGSLQNGSDSKCVNVSTYIPVAKGDSVFLEIKSEPPANAFFTYGYIVYKSDNTATSQIVLHNDSSVNNNKVQITADDAAYIRFTIAAYDLNTGSQVILRKTNYDASSVKAYINSNSFTNAEISDDILKQSTNIAYERNKVFDHILAATCRYSKYGNYQRDFCALLITDSHNDSIAVSNSVVIANGFQYISALVHCGDFCQNNANDFQAESYNNTVLCGKPFLFIVGNHDVGNSKEKAKCLTNVETYNRYIKPLVDANILKSGEYESGKSYYYHDFDEFNIRFICVYEYDDPNDTDPTDSTKYRITRGSSVISQAQAEWFCNTLNNTPDGFSVIVATHNPFSNYAHCIDCKFTDYLYPNSSQVSQRLFSTDFWADAVHAFTTHTTYDCDMICTGDAEYLNSNNGKYFSFSFNFTNTSPDFLGYLGGHVHQDCVWKHDIYTDQLQVSPLCANTIQSAMSRNGDIRRTILDSPSKDSLTAVGFDADGHNLRLAKIGVNITDKMRYRDFELISTTDN